MCVDMHHADWPLAAERLENRQRDGVVATNGHGDDTCIHDVVVEGLDVLMTLLEAEPASERNVADVGHATFAQRQHAQNMLVRPYPLDRAQCTRTEARSVTIGHSQIHWHADQ